MGTTLKYGWDLRRPISGSSSSRGTEHVYELTYACLILTEIGLELISSYLLKKKFMPPAKNLQSVATQWIISRPFFLSQDTDTSCSIIALVFALGAQQQQKNSATLVLHEKGLLLTLLWPSLWSHAFLLWVMSSYKVELSRAKRQGEWRCFVLSCFKVATGKKGTWHLNRVILRDWCRLRAF